nr:nuclear transport factor 2 family protein [Catenulispora rubra]
MGESLSEDHPALRRLLDKDALVDLVHRYSYCVDHQLSDELSALFTDDCVIDYGAGFAPVVRGRSAFRAMLAKNDERPGYLATSHHNANVLVVFDTDDQATVRTSVYAWHRTTAGATPQVWGHYHDVAVRTPEGWKLRERRLHLLGVDIEGWDGDYHRAAHTCPAIAAPGVPTGW